MKAGFPNSFSTSLGNANDSKENAPRHNACSAYVESADRVGTAWKTRPATTRIPPLLHSNRCLGRKEQFDSRNRRIAAFFPKGSPYSLRDPSKASVKYLENLAFGHGFAVAADN